MQDRPSRSEGDTYLLLSVGYDGASGKAYCKLYNERTGKVELLYDNTGHRPYCLTNLSVPEVEALLGDIRGNVLRVERVTKYSAMDFKSVEMTKVVVKDPLTIGGRSDSVRERIKCWEADIPYHLNYLYDRGYVIGVSYRKSEGGDLEPLAPPKEERLEPIRKYAKGLSREEEEVASEWISILEAELPGVPFASLDIEVYSPISTRVPSPSKADDKVIAVSICGSDGRREVYLLRRDREVIDRDQLNFNVKLYDSEREMLEDVFETISNYAVIATFNGDDFDLPYLHNRADRIGVSEEKNPIVLGREGATFLLAAHVDLYGFFMNKSTQIYAFDNKYREHTLDAITRALLGKGKVVLSKPISELSTAELAEYSFGDAELVYELLSSNDNLVLRLIFAISRISRLPLEDVCRHAVSGWIKNLMYYEHRRLNWLIPRPEDILAAKGETTTKAIIEGKKYRGAIVVEPVPGIHFGVKVLDFASLYPSALRKWNLSYETVRCPHEDCRSNVVPEVDHWVCTKYTGLQSRIIGALRDIRVNIYKPKSADKSLPPSQRAWYDVIQKALKVFLNASYGVFGFEEFPLYCPPLAESTASIGRYAFKATIERAKQHGVTVLYGDTDSIFVKDISDEVMRELIDWARRELGLDLEFDKEYVYTVFSVRKKNYLGLTTKGVVDVKGLTGKKRHIPEFIRAAFESMLNELASVRSEEDFDAARNKIIQLIRGWYQKLKRQEFELEELAFRVMLSKLPESYIKTTPQHVKAARLLQSKGIHVTSGDVISYVKTKDKIGVAPLHPAFPIRKENVDIDKYIEYLRGTFEQVLDSLDIDFEKVVGRYTVLGLDEFL
ncbi:MAG: DNA-directed DNA polymerase I [Aigarchaeota archaeon]|nr:DNA-directed DNA polymerase I [Aigarchaeota archaeon]MDW8093213.1 DNA-directed DNA polymerase I [Nitrososphaerota archaeon]